MVQKFCRFKHHDGFRKSTKTVRELLILQLQAEEQILTLELVLGDIHSSDKYYNYTVGCTNRI